MFEYFYHEILRKTVIGFGTLFNNIRVKQKNSSNQIVSEIKVPLAYGPTQKFLARLNQSPEDLNNPVQITLPRMSFEFVGLSYDSSRKVTTTQSFLVPLKTDGSKVTKAFMPVPYNMEFELSIMTKHNDDALQIIEQILPYFQPAYTVTINLVDSIGEKRDIPFTLNNVNFDDQYEGDFSTRRALIYTLRFTAKTYLFGPVSTSQTSDVIKKVSIGYLAGDSNGSVRDVTYRTDPVASKNYTDNVVTTLSDNLEISTNIFNVANSSSLSVGSYITIDGETMKIIGIDQNDNPGAVDTLTVERGYYGSAITEHVSGTSIKLITTADNDLIEFGDNFGFDTAF
jgi:hypothetical protein